MELAKLKVERLSGNLPGLTGTSGIADTVLVPLSTGAPKSEVVDNIGLQSHGGAAILFNSNTGMVIITTVNRRTALWSKSA